MGWQAIYSQEKSAAIQYCNGGFPSQPGYIVGKRVLRFDDIFY